MSHQDGFSLFDEDEVERLRGEKLRERMNAFFKALLPEEIRGNPKLSALFEVMASLAAEWPEKREDIQAQADAVIASLKSGEKKIQLDRELGEAVRKKLDELGANQKLPVFHTDETSWEEDKTDAEDAIFSGALDDFFDSVPTPANPMLAEIERKAQLKLRELEAKARAKGEALKRERDELKQAWRELEEARRLPGIEPSEQVLAPSYLLMAALDGELSADESARLEDQLASADALVRLEYEWLQRVRTATGSLTLAEAPESTWTFFAAGVADRIHEREQTSAVSRLERMAAKAKQKISASPEAPGKPAPPDVSPRAASAMEKLKVLRAGRPSKVSLRDLEQKGFRQVKVLRAGDINQLVYAAVQEALAKFPDVALSPAQREDLETRARWAVRSATAHAKKANQEAQRTEQSALVRLVEQLSPRTLPAPLSLDVFGRTERSVDLGGDLLDYVIRAEGFHTLLGDLSGKGLDAALALVSMRGTLRELCCRGGSPAAVLREANRQAKSELSTEQFMSAVVLDWSEPDRTLRWSGAGHEHLLVFRARHGVTGAIKPGGCVLGLIDGADRTYVDHDLKLDPGDVVLLYSDGLTEQPNAQGEFFSSQSPERLLGLLADLARLPAEGIVRGFFDALEAFRGDQSAIDDVTVVALKAR